MLIIRPAQLAALRTSRRTALGERLASTGVAAQDIDSVLAAAAEYRIASQADIVRFADILVRSHALPGPCLSKPAINALRTHASAADARLERLAALQGVPHAPEAQARPDASDLAADALVVPCAQPPGRADDAIHWIEIAMVGDDRTPVAWEAYIVELPDGQVVKGFLDEHGCARIDAIASVGHCKVSFPRLDRRAWDPDDRSVAP